ncbi:cell wall protein IFF6-like isoform X1 [Belonocnema kinseyi]|uniref:cell wall protein IFF6-like isoform X1 n=1 Tax=Belonocnema kinseyi TaxID=2817044 RepID=UPI00143D3AC6|nr:cell wall protein IFF6-like isoform X1 [Belonocnema kinseyi]
MKLSLCLVVLATIFIHAKAGPALGFDVHGSAGLSSGAGVTVNSNILQPRWEVNGQLGLDHVRSSLESLSVDGSGRGSGNLALSKTESLSADGSGSGSGYLGFKKEESLSVDTQSESGLGVGSGNRVGSMSHSGLEGRSEGVVVDALGGDLYQSESIRFDETANSASRESVDGLGTGSQSALFHESVNKEDVSLDGFGISANSEKSESDKGKGDILVLLSGSRNGAVDGSCSGNADVIVEIILLGSSELSGSAFEKAEVQEEDHEEIQEKAFVQEDVQEEDFVQGEVREEGQIVV